MPKQFTLIEITASNQAPVPNPTEAAAAINQAVARTQPT